MTPNHKKRGDNDSLTCRLTKFLLTASISNLTIMMTMITMKIILIRPQLYTCNNSPDTQKTFWVAIALLPCCPGFCASNAHTTPEACRVQFKGVVAKVGGDHGFRASHLRARLHLQLLVPFFKFSSNSCFLFSRGPTPLAVFQLLMDLQELWGSHVSPFLLTTASATILE